MSATAANLVCYATLPDGYGFEPTVAAAAAAGFTQLSLWLMSIDAARTELGSLQAVRDCLDGHSMEATCLELLLAWPSGDTAAARGELDVMQAAAEVMQPRLVLAACMEPSMPDEGRAVAQLKMQCRALAPLRVALEFLPWSAIPDLPTARRIVEAVDEDNLGYLIDTWHFARTGQDFEALEALPGERIFFIQLGDASAEPAPNIFDDTLKQRLRPGEGIVDWPRLRSVLAAKNLECPVGTEQYSDVVKAMPLDRACRYLYDSIQGVL